MQGSRSAEGSKLEEAKAEGQKFKQEREKIRTIAIKLRKERDEIKKQVRGQAARRSSAVSFLACVSRFFIRRLNSFILTTIYTAREPLCRIGRAECQRPRRAGGQGGRADGESGQAQCLA